MSDKSELFYACAKFSEKVTTNSLDDECFINLAKAFREAVENKVQISFPTFLEDSQGRKIILAFADKRGELAGMYANPATLPAYKEVAKIPNISDKKNMEAIISGRCEVGDTVADIMTASFDEFLELVFDYPKLAGIRIIDVTSKLGSLTFDKDFILKLMLHAHLPKINRKFYPPRDWGKGIPDYKESDLMTDDELQDFAVELITETLSKDLPSAQLISVSIHPKAIANFILSDKNGQFHLIYVKGSCVETRPAIPEAVKESLKKYAKFFNCKCYYAPAGFRSPDPLRFEKCLALQGDAFMCNYKGLIPIDEL